MDVHMVAARLPMIYSIWFISTLQDFVSPEGYGGTVPNTIPILASGCYVTRAVMYL